MRKRAGVAPIEPQALAPAPAPAQAVVVVVGSAETSGDYAPMPMAVYVCAPALV